MGVALTLTLGLACAPKREVKSQRLADGTVRITCQTTLQTCLDSADLICKGKTYDVLHARDQREQFGAELGTSQVETRSSEAVIRCSGAPAAEGEADVALAPPAAKPAAAPVPPPAPATPPVPVVPPRACVPGSTQACVGPGACEGGQSCLPNGAGFGPCDCGTIGAPATAPKPPPPAPEEPPKPSKKPAKPPPPAPEEPPKPSKPPMPPRAPVGQPKKPEPPPVQPSPAPLPAPPTAPAP